MTKPKKERKVMHPPVAVYFKPTGVPLFQLEQVILTVDEYEAIRLGDDEELKHEEASLKMKISRPTFTRLLNSAHKKIANALVNGKAIRIEGGSYIFLNNRYFCSQCRHIWSLKQGSLLPEACPECGSSGIVDLSLQCGYGKGHGGRGRRCRHGNKSY
ncbi:MAG: DUF134 domain-containing protein [Spirochaetes bacterium]|nr:DUF134 domain-containing protein [Spirochaetota bacterium]